MLIVPDDCWELDLARTNDREEILIFDITNIEVGDLVKIVDRVGYVYESGTRLVDGKYKHLAWAYLAPIGAEDPHLWFLADRKQALSMPCLDQLRGLKLE